MWVLLRNIVLKSRRAGVVVVGREKKIFNKSPKMYMDMFLLIIYSLKYMYFEITLLSLIHFNGDGENPCICGFQIYFCVCKRQRGCHVTRSNLKWISEIGGNGVTCIKISCICVCNWREWCHVTKLNLAFLSVIGGNGVPFTCKNDIALSS